MTHNSHVDDSDEFAGADNLRRHQTNFTQVPAWGQLALAFLGVIVAVMLAYGSLDRRIAVADESTRQLRERITALDLKIDLLLREVRRRPPTE